MTTTELTPITNLTEVFSRWFGKRLCEDRKAWARRSESVPPRPSAYPV